MIKKYDGHKYNFQEMPKEQIDYKIMVLLSHDLKDEFKFVAYFDGLNSDIENYILLIPKEDISIYAYNNEENICIDLHYGEYIVLNNKYSYVEFSHDNYIGVKIDNN